MTWLKDQPYRPEVQKCRPRLMHYCQGIGLDIGCGPEKIHPEAIGIDRAGANLNTDLSRGLNILADESMDFVFSSHCLEDFYDPGGILSEWWRVLKVGGKLVLYLPHREHYPNMGQEGANPAHKHDFVPEDILDLMTGLAAFEVLHNEVHAQADEYSFDLVLEKKASLGAPAMALVQEQPAKRALLIRYGAFGDMIIATPVLKRLKQDGYHVTVNCTTAGLSVIENNPHVDDVWLQGHDFIPPEQLGPYWEKIGQGFDKVVNLSETLEIKWLFASFRDQIERAENSLAAMAQDDPQLELAEKVLHNLEQAAANYRLPVLNRRAMAGGVNYYDYALKVAGYEDVEAPRGELFPTEIERGMANHFRRKHHDHFVIMWALSGSALHKLWQDGGAVAQMLMHIYEDIHIVTVGDAMCRLLEDDFSHPAQSVKRSGDWDIRTSLIMTGFVDLVIGPETGILNAAGCFDTPKIGLLTHSSDTNLTKHFKNCQAMQAAVPCSPCHRLLYSRDVYEDCRCVNAGYDPELKVNVQVPVCAVKGFDPAEVTRNIEEIYFRWHKWRGTEPRLSAAGRKMVAPQLLGPDGSPVKAATS